MSTAPGTNVDIMSTMCRHTPAKNSRKQHVVFPLMRHTRDNYEAVFRHSVVEHREIITKITETITRERMYRMSQKSNPLSNQSINQSINVKFVGRRYSTLPGVPTGVSGKHDQKVHS